MIRIGAHARGEINGHALLTERAVLSIRERYAQGDSSTVLALEFGVADSAISAVIRGDRWRHVGGPIVRQGRAGRRTLTHCQRGP